MAETERWPRLVGGRPSLDLVNTDGYDVVLQSGEAFLSWCRYAGLAVSPRLTPAAERALLRDARRLRAALRSVMTSLASGGGVPGEMAAIQAIWADAVRSARPVLDEGRLRWTWDPAAPSSALSELAADAVDLLTQGPLGRLKECPGCGFVFLDTTKNGARRWCSMEDCGKEEKMRRYVAKRAKARAGAER
ncbi:MULTISPECIES: CGNR zinc finger domain-containing protein [unclassified Nocardioides]|uniref:CGNR zinc finger domain-containing protein n=1 Tax=unclassified Nocardioides TaxID=2615069 RepID=UPI00360FFD5D